MADKKKKAIDSEAAIEEERWRRLVEDPNAMRKVLKEVPDLAKALGEFGDLSKRARAAWLDLVAGKENRGVQTLQQNHLDQFEADLAGENASPLERVLIQRIAACWLQVQHADQLVAQRLGEGASIEVGTYLQQLQERASKRFNAAVTTLAQVRRLSVPLLQLNIGAALPAREPPKALAAHVPAILGDFLSPPRAPLQEASTLEAERSGLRQLPPEPQS